MRTQSAFLPRSQPAILWLCVLALAIFQGAFTFAWVSYRIHLPGELKLFGFADGIAAVLLLIEALLAIGIEPLAGKLSDRLQQRGSRFPVISAGVTLATTCFVAVSVLVTFVQPSGAVRWLLPALLITWGISMSLFRSPAFALLQRYAAPVRLVQAASFLTCAAGLVGAVAPLGKPLLLTLGAPIAFTFSAILLLSVTALLRSVNPLALPALPSAPRRTFSIGALVWIGGLGLSVMLVFRLLTQTFPALLAAHLPAAHKPLLIGAIFISLGLAALPMGRLAVQVGVRKTMLAGLIATAIGFLLLSVVTSASAAFAVAIVLGITFSLVLNGTLPLVLAIAPVQDAGLAIGTFLGGSAAATSLFEPAQSLFKQPSPVAFWAGMAALLVAGLCVVASESELD